MVLVKLWIFHVFLNFKFINSNNYYNNYNDDYFSKDNVRLRTKFIEKKRQNEKIKLFEKLNSNKTVFVDNILHFLSNDPKAVQIEESFRNTIAMKDAKYIFKRDFFWRTWRQVQENQKLTVICYRCQNNMDGKCQAGGYWVIEEKPPPCPYEIFSLKTNWEICVANYDQYTDSVGICPSIINRLDLTTSCNNPIRTRWRISKKFDANSERNLTLAQLLNARSHYTKKKNSINVICQGRENCEISTTYTIDPDMIVFRIINSTNHIFYSRVMKSGFKNYICADDCGRIGPKSNVISNIEQPYRVNLLKKNKREDLLSVKSVLPVEKRKCNKLNKGHVSHKLHFDIIDLAKNRKVHLDIMDMAKNLSTQGYQAKRYHKEKNSVTKSPCKILEDKYYENENNIDGNY